MGQWDSNLHHRQENNDGYGSRGRKPIPRTRIFVMLLVVLVGLVLTFASPLPGLGVSWSLAAWPDSG